MTAAPVGLAGTGAAFTDPCDTRLALRAPGLLGEFNRAGVLSAVDVHVALRFERFGPETQEGVLLAAALAVRAPRLGHVHVDLAAVRHTATVDVDVPVDLQALPWPDPEGWVPMVAASPLVAHGEDGPDDRPLRLIGSWLYLDRYWREERQVAADLAVRAEHAVGGVDLAVLRAGLDRLFPAASGEEGADRQRLAAATAVLRPLAVVAGGPGTGKTTTVARILALLDDQARAAGAPPPLVALTAPTGKAAARLEEAVHEEAATLDVADDVRTRLLATHASTLHRLLGWQPGNRSRFRHHRGNRLPHDVVVVDETSMVSLSQMAKLSEAVRPDARLVLVGDPQQLASVEAGAVLGDIVGPASIDLLMRQAARAALADATGETVDADDPPAGTAIGDGIVVLRRVHRFGGGIAALADSIRRGDGDATIAALSGAHDDVTWIPLDLAAPPLAGPNPATIAGLEPKSRSLSSGAPPATLAAVRAAAVDVGTAIADAARAGDARAALEALGGFRMLCAHRRGPYGV
ncbi:MAG TPA: AAA family ATPase, partial [Acidimicrobiia bacterium]|nr:AAA family ATPase [Acidimicrobiia bacterium]